MQLFLRAVLSSGTVTLLVASAVLSDEIDMKEALVEVERAAAKLENGKVITVRGGRVTSLVPPFTDIADLHILEQPEHGHVSVNPDNTIALVLTRTNHFGALSFRYGITMPSGRTRQHNAMINVTESTQKDNWGTGVNHYMLPVGSAERLIVEPGEIHRKVYVSGDGLTAADIAQRHWNTSEDEVTASWLQNEQPDYGATETMALSPDLGLSLWHHVNNWNGEASHWLLLERGYDYDGKIYRLGSSGESPLNPLFVGAWGTGDKPRILSAVTLFRLDIRNIVFQDLHFTGGFGILELADNILLDNVVISNEEPSIQGTAGVHSGITIRNTTFRDVWKEKPRKEGSEKWSAIENRTSGIYISNVDGLLLDGTMFDHNGWAPDFAPDASVDGGHPPSMYSHNLYLQQSTRDVTMRNSISMRGASFGAQFRGGAFLEDNFFLDNNIPFNLLGGDYNGKGPIGNYSLIHGNVVTHSARRGAGLPKIGAIDWGVRNEALLTTLIDNIIAHANDPDDLGDTSMAQSALTNTKGVKKGLFSNDTIIWRWGIGRGGEDGTEANANALDPDTLNTTTIQRYTADLLGQDTATIDDFGKYLRTLDGSGHAAATQDVLSYFRAGFGIVETARDTATTARFVPDPRGDGVRWDNRLNWDSGDLPGMVAGDSVDLGGNEVVFAGDVTVGDLTFGPDGRLVLTHGRLQIAGDLVVERGAKIQIDRAGQLWAGATTGREPLALTVAGGRFVNAGAFDGPVTLTAAGGQTLLATGGSEFHLDSHSRIHIDGAGSKIGFDGDGLTLLRFASGAVLEFTVVAGKVSPIKEFHSGAFGASSAVRSGIDLDGASLTVNLTDPAALDPLMLIDVDEVVGTFDDVTVQSLGDRDASIVINYRSDIVTLQLSSGTGQVSMLKIGTQDMIESGNSEIRDRLRMIAEQ